MRYLLILLLVTTTAAASYFNETTIGGTNLDSFSRIRVSTPGYRFDGQFTYQLNNDMWDYKLAAGGTVAYDSAFRAVSLSCTNQTSSSAVLQSHYNIPYTPGRGQLAFMTFLSGTNLNTGVSHRIGLYDEINQYGIYLEQTGTGTNIVLNPGSGITGTYPIQTIPQSQWNIDTLTSGTLNPSGKQLNMSKVQIFLIQFQALYVGRVVCGFDIDGQIVPVHQFLHANNITSPYIQQANLPVHYSIRNTGTNTTGSFRAICASVMSEGGRDLEDLPGRSFTAANGVTTIGATARRPILSIQCSGSLNAVAQNAVVVPTHVSVNAQSNIAYVEVVRNGTLTNASFTAVDAAGSVMNRDVAATAITGGTVVAAFYVAGAGGAGPATSNEERTLSDKIAMCYSHLGSTGTAAGDTLSVVVTPFTGTSTVSAVLQWKEIR